MVRRSVLALGSPLLFVLCLLMFQPSPASSQFDSDRAGFSVRFRNDVNPHTVLGLFVVPGERVPFEVLSGRLAEAPEAPASTYEVEVVGGKVTHSGPRSWVWEAPEAKGLYPMQVTERPSGRTMLFNALVMVRNPPYRQVLNGYRLGSYPPQPLRGISAYLPPKGFIEVSAEFRNVPVAPHFTLGQFLCKQGGGELQYMALRERLQPHVPVRKYRGVKLHLNCPLQRGALAWALARGQRREINMYFEHSETAKTWIDRVQCFTDDHIVPAVATYEAQQKEGGRWKVIPVVEELKAKAKAAGAYKGRRPSIDVAQVRKLHGDGVGPAEIARKLKIGRASVYRVLAA